MNAVVNRTEARTPNWTHNFAWLLKRELWEHRSLYIAPLVCAGIMLFGILLKLSYFHGGSFVIEGVHLNQLGDSEYRGARQLGYLALALPFNLVMFVVIAIYSMGTLSSERRNRSILFWKSLPISDTETVLSKLTVAMIVAPLISVIIAIVVQWLVFILLGFAMLANGQSFFTLWHDVSILDEASLMLYAVLTQSLWYAPIWAWCLLASSWANRATFLWVISPPLALMLLEKLIVGTNSVSTMLGHRLNGVVPLSISVNGPVTQETIKRGDFSNFINPGAFLAAPELWIGLTIAGALIAATVWVRRFRETA